MAPSVERFRPALAADVCFVPSIMNMEEAMQEMKPTAIAKPEAETVVE